MFKLLIYRTEDIWKKTGKNNKIMKINWDNVSGKLVKNQV